MKAFEIYQLAKKSFDKNQKDFDLAYWKQKITTTCKDEDVNIRLLKKYMIANLDLTVIEGIDLLDAMELRAFIETELDDPLHLFDVDLTTHLSGATLRKVANLKEYFDEPV